MAASPEHGLLHPASEADRVALACLMRLRSEGRSLDEIADGLRAETGLAVSPEALDQVLRRVAGPVPCADGGDPEYFSGYLGGG
jgi:hypothetical protein